VTTSLTQGAQMGSLSFGLGVFCHHTQKAREHQLSGIQGHSVWEYHSSLLASAVNNLTSSEIKRATIARD
jgi:hypothetical protein